jgi:hypothetical protein
MSGAFNYPREEHHVVLNVDDVVEVSWWSTFADTLVVNCYEAGDINGQLESESHIDLPQHCSSTNKEQRLQHRNLRERNRAMVASLSL